MAGDDAEDPILTFPPGDDGLAKAQAAFRSETQLGRWSKILVVAAIIAAPIWIVGLLIERG